MARPAAVFFDVDFTLISPGPRFQGQGYQETCAKYGMTVDPDRFSAAVAAATPLLESCDHVYRHEIFHNYTRRIIELMGGADPLSVSAAAEEIFLAWADHRHFVLYPDVRASLERIHALGIRIGLISNTHRCLTSFEADFGLDGLIAGAVSSYDHGFMKPHPSIFRAALALLEVKAPDAVMVGDSLVHDVQGAIEAGMRGILLARGGPPAAISPDVPVIRSLEELRWAEEPTPAANRTGGRPARAGAGGRRSGPRRRCS